MNVSILGLYNEETNDKSTDLVVYVQADSTFQVSGEGAGKVFQLGEQCVLYGEIQRTGGDVGCGHEGSAVVVKKNDDVVDGGSDLNLGLLEVAIYTGDYCTKEHIVVTVQSTSSDTAEFTGTWIQEEEFIISVADHVNGVATGLTFSVQKEDCPYLISWELPDGTDYPYFWPNSNEEGLLMIDFTNMRGVY